MAFPAYDDVEKAAIAILNARITPTVRAVAEHLGGTKNHTVIAQHLRTLAARDNAAHGGDAG